jgi:hypothetical protein
MALITIGETSVLGRVKAWNSVNRRYFGKEFKLRWTNFKNRQNQKGTSRIGRTRRESRGMSSFHGILCYSDKNIFKGILSISVIILLSQNASVKTGSALKSKSSELELKG